MSTSPSSTPRADRDPKLDQLRALLRSLLDEGRNDEAIDLALSLLERLQSNNTELTLELAKLRRERSGKRNERISPDQLSLMLQLVPFSDGGEAGDQAATG